MLKWIIVPQALLTWVMDKKNLKPRTLPGKLNRLILCEANKDWA